MAYTTSILCISVEVFCFFGVIILNVVLYELMSLRKGGIEPFKRGFFCNDHSIMKPYRKESVSFEGVLSAGIVISLAVIIFYEVGNHFSKPRPTREPMFSKKNQVGKAKIPTFLIRMLHRMAIFGVGLTVLLIFCDVIKVLSGRLRPHFLAVCKPNTTLFNCSSGYITADVCTGDPLKVKMARVSFPSIHTSCTAYSLVFSAICLQGIVFLSNFKMFRIILQTLMFVFAIAVGLSRISDYYHHWSDVVAGAFIGAFTAWIVAVKTMKLFEDTKPKTPYTMIPNVSDEEGVETTEKTKQELYK